MLRNLQTKLPGASLRLWGTHSTTGLRPAAAAQRRPSTPRRYYISPRVLFPSRELSRIRKGGALSSSLTVTQSVHTRSRRCLSRCLCAAYSLTGAAAGTMAPAAAGALLLLLLLPAALGLVPTWEPTFNMALSTTVMPCNNAELMSSGPNWPTIRGYGLIDIDWSNAKQHWINTEPMSCEEDLLKQAELIKANNTLGAKQKVWVYRNGVWAMPWMTHTRKLLVRLCQARACSCLSLLSQSLPLHTKLRSPRAGTGRSCVRRVVSQVQERFRAPHFLPSRSLPRPDPRSPRAVGPIRTGGVRCTTTATAPTRALCATTISRRPNALRSTMARSSRHPATRTVTAAACVHCPLCHSLARGALN